MEARTSIRSKQARKEAEKQESMQARKYAPRAGAHTSKQALKLANNQAKLQASRWERKQDSKEPIK